MTRYQVDSDAVLTSVSGARGTIARIQGEVSGLTADLGALQGAWTGPAATAFQSLLGEWTTTQRQVEQMLASIAEALGSAGTHYAEIEQANARLFLR